jgi:HCOMODA/2-hydroxy-3-carboxy-muconic semialdehyde decarboxylase
MITEPERHDQDVRLAARALAGAGLVHAYGHCSTRIDSERFLVSAPMPLALAVENICIVCPVAGGLPDGILGEVRVHQAIYAARSEIGAVCRIMPPALMALSTQGIVPRPRHGIGAYFPDLPLWDDPRLLRDDAAAKGLATRMGTAPAIVMRGNGAVVAASDLQRAVALCWFLEDAARVERDIRAMGCDPEAGLLTEEETGDRQVWSGRVAERMWELLTKT